MKFISTLTLFLCSVPFTDAFQLPSRLEQRTFSLDVKNGQGGISLAKNVPYQSTPVLMAVSPEETVVESISPSNIAFGVAWVALLGFTAFVAPGSFGAESDNNMIAKIIENPLLPDINLLFYFVFNLFAIVPVCLASVILPQASDKGAPPVPFLMASAFVGYFALGPYLTFKGESKDEVVLEDLNWATKNLFENKAFNWLQVVLFIYFATTYAIQPAMSDPTNLLSGFQELLATSKFACVSTADLTLLSLTAAAFIPQDYKLRSPENASRATLIGASTLLVPVLGSALYCALRPKLPTA